MTLRQFLSKKEMFRPAFGCAQHPKASRNTQHPTLYQINDATPLYIKQSKLRKVRLNLDKKILDNSSG